MISRPEIDAAEPMVLSYLGIRRAVGGLALMLPVALGPVGWLVFGIEIQENISSYYHTALRDVFVGVMCAIGLFLFCYRGNGWLEDWTGNLGCLAAVGVALCPLDANSDPLNQSSILGYLHTVFGGVFFITLAIFSVYHFPKNEAGDEASAWQARRNLLIRLTGVTILGSLIAMGVHLFLLDEEWQRTLNGYRAIFWLESIAVWAFAIAWLIKGRAQGMIGEGFDIVKRVTGVDLRP